MNDLSRYHQNRDKMQTGDLLQFSGNGIISKIIKLRTGKFSHSSLVMNFNEYGRRMTMTAEPRGVYPVLLSEYLGEYNGRVWWYPLVDEWEVRRRGIGGRALDMSGIGYDYGSLFKQALLKVSANTRKLFCSELCFLAYGFDGKAPNPSEMPSLGIFKEPVRIL